MKKYYEQLSPQGRNKLIALTKEVNVALGTVSSQMLVAGRALREAKQLVGSIHWNNYVSFELPILELDVANRLIKIADWMDSNEITDEQMATFNAVDLHWLVRRTVSDAVRERMAERVKEGNPPADVWEVVDEVRQLSPQTAYDYRTEMLSKAIDNLAKMRTRLEPYDDTLPIVKAIAKVEDEIVAYLTRKRRSAA